MDYSRRYIVCGVITIVMTIVFLISTVLMMSGKVLPFVDCFAVDASERVYIGGSDNIFVYEKGQLKYEFSDLPGFKGISMKGTFFTITGGNRFLMETGNRVYTLDLEGNVIGACDYSESTSVRLNAERNGKRFTSQKGDHYELRNVLGWTTITKNHREVVYEISALSYIVKISIIISVISSFLAIGTAVVTALRERMAYG